MSRRQPLGEVTQSANNRQDPGGPSRPRASRFLPHHESQKTNGVLQNQVHPQRPAPSQNNANNKENGQAVRDLPDPRGNTRRPRPISEDAKPKPKARIGHTESGIKTEVGPWILGMDLGQGASAHVRKAKHKFTGKIVAVKIIAKANSNIVPSGSLAVLEKLEEESPDTQDPHRMPLTIEREVAIMKLIDHPHILKLHDIWENRNEIYLVVDFVDKGEYFDYIASRGRLQEPEAMKFWRQMISAVGYCHSFNICHRDLKPENILINSEGLIKIADFGMAAIHQSRSHRLTTSCGSPHYAAPEVIAGNFYSGNKADVWSLGVILYASLAGNLPFDHPGPGIAPLLKLVRTGKYKMSDYFSRQARDLIARLLRVPAEERPTIQEMWDHPMVFNYDYLDKLSMANKDPYAYLNTPFERPARVSEIEEPVLRHLRAMWHTFSEAQLVECLMSDRPNEQQRCYALLKDFRTKNLEEYNSNGLDYSSSDYHHLRPLNEVRKLSTRHFFQPSRDGRGQSVSAFTVIGPGLKDPNDPFNESKARKEDPSFGYHYPLPSDYRHTSTAQKPSEGLLPSSIQGYPASSSSRTKDPLGLRKSHTRTSLAGSPPGAVKPKVGKRGVSFTRQNPSSSSNARGQSQAEASDDPRIQSNKNLTSDLRSEQYIRSKKAKKTVGEMMQPAVPQKSRSKRISRFWEDDVRKISNTLERDCEMAFNLEKADSLRVGGTGSGVPSKHVSTDGFSSFAQDDPSIESSPRLPHNLQQKSGKAWWRERPLPQPPGRTESIKAELLAVRRRAELRRASGNPEARPGHLDKVINHVNNLMEPSSPSRPAADRRTRSAPVHRKGDGHAVLPSIEETSSIESGSDFGSQVLPKLPKTSRAKHENSTLKNTEQSFQKKGVRIVPASSNKSLSPIRPTPPLNIRKKSAQNGQPALMTGALRKEANHKNHRYHEKLREAQAAEYRNMGLPRIDESDTNEFEENSNGTIRQKKVWFRGSSSNGDLDVIPKTGKGLTKPEPDTIKKRGFGGFGTFFKKREQPQRGGREMKIVFEEEDSMATSLGGPVRGFDESGDLINQDVSARLIETQHNWIARLFNWKPAHKYICCVVSKRRTRQEIVRLLKENKSHGVKDIVVDKERCIVFAKIDGNNTLKLKPLSVAFEIMAVVEHGHRDPLSIIRMTQEKGALSTFTYLHTSLKEKLYARGMLLNDEKKSAMMIETLSHLKYAR